VISPPDSASPWKRTRSRRTTSPPEILARKVEAAEPPPAQEEPKNLGSIERMFLIETMRRFHGNAVAAARTLGITP
jgi:transcriptional regulator with GAF, ATPase, and Fis domain